MYRFRQWFAQFMIGRYGMDDLNRCLAIVTLILIVLDLFVNWRPVDLLVLVGLVVLYFRMFSRNGNARYRENQRFLALLDQLQGWLGVRKGARPGSSGNGRSSAGGYGRPRQGTGQTRTDGPEFTVVGDEAHTILICPSCGEKLRVPKGAGNILVRCPHCSGKFKKTV